MTRYMRMLRYLSIFLIAVSAVLYTVAPRFGVQSAILFFTGIILFAACSVFTYRHTDEEGRKRATRSGIEVLLFVVLAALVLILIQVFSIRHNIKIDTTANSRFSLSSQARSVIGHLEDQITITSFQSDTSEDRKRQKDLFSAFRNQNDLIDYRFVNPDREPALARRYKVKNFGVTIVESGGSSEKLYSVTENSVANAIYRLVNRTSIKACFTTGHGEKSIHDRGPEGYADLAVEMKGENYSPVSLSIPERRSVPHDCSILIIAGPRRELLAIEKTAIARYLQSGRSVLFLLDPVTPVSEINDIISEYAISADNNLVVDRSGVLTTGNYLTPVVNRYSGHPITANFKYFSFFPQSRSVSRIDTMKAAASVSLLCFTNKNAYAETDLDMILEGRTSYDSDTDVKGPVSLAAVFSKAGSGGSVSAGEGASMPRIAVFGDSDFASNKVIDLYGNRDLIMNTINWLAMEEEMISIRPKKELVQPVLLTRSQGRLVFWLSTIILPSVILIIGAARLSRRRKYSQGWPK